MAAHCQGIDQLLPEQLTKLAIDADRARRADCPRPAVDRPTQVGQQGTVTIVVRRVDQIGPAGEISEVTSGLQRLGNR